MNRMLQHKGLRHVSGCRGPILRLALLCAVMLMSACASTTFVYNRLDFLLPWYVDDYADLNRQQDEYLDELLEPFLNWHRSQELPRYVEVLERAQANLEPPVVEEDIAAVMNDFQEAWARLEGESIEWLLALGSELSDKQIAGFLEVLEEQQLEYEKKYLTRSDEEFFDENYDIMRDNARDYVGKLSKEQKQLLQDASRQMERSDDVWLQEREHWNKELAVYLQREPGWEQKIRDAIDTRATNPPEEFTLIYEHNLKVINGMLVDLLNNLSQKQNEHLKNKFADLQKDLDTLIAQGEKLQETKSI